MSVWIIRLAAFGSGLALVGVAGVLSFVAIRSFGVSWGISTFAALAALAYLGGASVFAILLLRRSVLRRTARSGTRGMVAFFAAVVLLAILFPTVGLTNSWLGMALYLGFILLYTLAFILPGLAYRRYRQPYGHEEPPGEPVAELPFRPEEVRRWRWLTLVGLLLFFFGMIQGLAGMLFIAATPSPEWRAAGWRWLPVTTAVFLLPILPALLLRRYSGGTGGLDSPLGQKIILILGGLGFCTLFAYYFQTKTLVWGWNKFTDAAFKTQTFMVAKAEPRSGLRGCHARIIAFAEDRPEATLDLCNYPRAFVETLHTGDAITATSRTSYFGMSEIGLRRFRP